MLQRFVFAAVLALVFSAIVVAQEIASCFNSSWIWSWNSLGQDPCHVAQALGNQCDPSSSFSVAPVPSGYYYSGMNPISATECTCNKVYYSLLSVCGQCQNSFAAAWDLWDANCSVVYSSYPKSLPAGFNVPDWAYQPLLAGGTVNFAAAQSDHNPESTAPISQTAFTTPPPGPTDGSSKKTSTNVAAIAGGTVGGVVVLVLVALLVWFLLRRRQQNQSQSPPSSTFTTPPNAPLLAQTVTYTPIVSEKPYDPNDPSTYPTSLASTPPTPLSPPVSFGSSTSTAAPPPIYRGTPEAQTMQQQNTQMPGNMLQYQPHPAWQAPQPPQFHGAPIPQV